MSGPVFHHNSPLTPEDLSAMYPHGFKVHITLHVKATPEVISQLSAEQHAYDVLSEALPEGVTVEGGRP